jgi:hypothetical protein
MESPYSNAHICTQIWKYPYASMTLTIGKIYDLGKLYKFQSFLYEGSVW